ncbi:hypothetical protein D6774_00635 [Candidatus Woesearchaeota archaeon]|nr:MAG: hypothetical protein D6774_00635 [Candidatus Woesearchaeota archaeon]
MTRLVLVALCILLLPLVLALPQSGIGISPGCTPNEGVKCLTLPVNHSTDLVTFSFRVFNWEQKETAFDISAEGIEPWRIDLSTSFFTLDPYVPAGSCEENPGCEEVFITINTSGLHPGNYSGYVTATSVADSGGMIAVRQAVKGKFSFEKLARPPTMFERALKVCGLVIGVFAVIALLIYCAYRVDKKHALRIRKTITHLDNGLVRVRIILEHRAKLYHKPIKWVFLADNVAFPIKQVKLFEITKELQDDHLPKKSLVTTKVKHIKDNLLEHIKKQVESRTSFALLHEEKLYLHFAPKDNFLEIKKGQRFLITYDYREDDKLSKDKDAQNEDVPEEDCVEYTFSYTEVKGVNDVFPLIEELVPPDEQEDAHDEKNN